MKQAPEAYTASYVAIETAQAACMAWADPTASHGERRVAADVLHRWLLRQSRMHFEAERWPEFQETWELARSIMAHSVPRPTLDRARQLTGLPPLAEVRAGSHVVASEHTPSFSPSHMPEDSEQ